MWYNNSMNNIQFDSDQQQFKTNSGFNSAGPKGLSGWLIRNGIAKDEAGANKVMIAIFIIDLVLIFLVIQFFL